MHSIEEIQNLLGKIRDFNTEQRVAAENNKPIKSKIEKAISSLDSPSIKQHPRMRSYVTEIDSIIGDVKTLINTGPTTNLKRALEDKQKLVTRISVLADKMYKQMEGELNESQN